jgi:L-ascorbate metabolism protein UlaG (beta-lactamase superfamily)
VEITWLGYSCTRLRGRETSVLTDPLIPADRTAAQAMTADIVTISHSHPNHSSTKELPGKFRVLQGAGEYEIGGVFIQAVPAFHDAKGGKERGKNIIFRIDIDDLAVCHLGDLGHTLSSSQVEAIGTVHILLIPVGGHTTIDAAQAAEVASTLQPRIVIPMHYNNGAPGVGGLESVDRFCKEMGATGLKPQARANVTRTNLPAETQVLLLEQVTKGGTR